MALSAGPISPRRADPAHVLLSADLGLRGRPGGQAGLQGSAPPQVICQVSLAQVSDVDQAVAAAKDAFEHGLWGKISARDRGRLLYRWDLARTRLPVPGLPLRPQLALASSRGGRGPGRAV